MSAFDVIASSDDIDARLALHRDELWSIAIHARLLCAESARLFRRSHWQARRAHHLAQKIYGGRATKPRPRGKSGRRRGRTRLVAVK